MRAELFSVAQLEQHARTLAGWHEPIAFDQARDSSLLDRLADNEEALREGHGIVAEALARGRKITPAAEWFIDNDHLIEEQIRTARLHLPRAYHRELPQLANAPASSSPRVYVIAHELISHSHGRVDLHRLRAFVDACPRTACSATTCHPRAKRVRGRVLATRRVPGRERRAAIVQRRSQ